MPVNDAKKFLKFVQTQALFSQLFGWTLSIYFISVRVLIKMVINQKLLLRLILIYPRMSILIFEKLITSNSQLPYFEFCPVRSRDRCIHLQTMENDCCSYYFKNSFFFKKKKLSAYWNNTKIREVFSTHLVYMT